MGGTPTHPSPTTGWKEREGGRYSHTPFSHYRLEGEGGWEVLPHTLLPLPVGRRGRVGGTPTHPSPTTGWKEREGGRYSHTPFSHYRLEGEGGWEVLPHTLLPLPVGRRGRVGGTPTHPSPTTGWKEREGGRYSHTPFSHYRLEGEGGWEVLPHTLLPLPVGTPTHPSPKERGRVGGTPTHPSPTTGWKEREGGRYSHTPFSHYRLEGEGGWEVLPHTLPGLIYSCIPSPHNEEVKKTAGDALWVPVVLLFHSNSIYSFSVPSQGRLFGRDIYDQYG